MLELSSKAKKVAGAADGFREHERSSARTIISWRIVNGIN